MHRSCGGSTKYGNRNRQRGEVKEGEWRRRRGSDSSAGTKCNGYTPTGQQFARGSCARCCTHHAQQHEGPEEEAARIRVHADLHGRGGRMDTRRMTRDG